MLSPCMLEGPHSMELQNSFSIGHRTTTSFPGHASPLVGDGQGRAAVPELAFRSLQPCDYAALKAMHQELFPIDYDEAFYHKATTSSDRLFSFAALSHSVATGQQELVGFITARLMHAHECDPVDRHHLGLGSPAMSNTPVVYILTLGVTRGWQQKGVARMLLQHVHHRAQAMRWHAVFLHVISYNQAAIRLYNSQQYRCVAFLKNFYIINSGRQLHSDQVQYDAYLYALHMDGMQGPMQGLLGWQGAAAINMALAPIRNALGHFNSCMPWLCSTPRGNNTRTIPPGPATPGTPVSTGPLHLPPPPPSPATHPLQLPILAEYNNNRSSGNGWGPNHNTNNSSSSSFHQLSQSAWPEHQQGQQGGQQQQQQVEQGGYAAQVPLGWRRSPGDSQDQARRLHGSENGAVMSPQGAVHAHLPAGYDGRAQPWDQHGSGMPQDQGYYQQQPQCQPQYQQQHQYQQQQHQYQSSPPQYQQQQQQQYQQQQQQQYQLSQQPQQQYQQQPEGGGRVNHGQSSLLQWLSAAPAAAARH